MPSISFVAQKQHGLLTRAQVIDLGLSDGDIRGKLRAGDWQRVHQGVYRIAGSRETHEQAVLAACLAAGGVTLASHGCAARLHALPAGDDEIHVTRVGRQTPVRGATVHGVTGLQVPDCAVKNGIPLTTVARTLIDLAQSLPPARLEEVLDHALAARSVSLGALEQRLAKTGKQGRRGSGVLGGLLAVRLDESPRPRQRAERLFLRIVQQYGLPTPQREVEYRLSDGRTVYVDFVFCEVVGAEIDSYLHHSSLTDWAADRSRNNLLRAQGLTLLNITEPQMRSDPAGVAAPFEEALVSRGAR